MLGQTRTHLLLHPKAKEALSAQSPGHLKEIKEIKQTRHSDLHPTGCWTNTNKLKEKMASAEVVERSLATVVHGSAGFTDLGGGC